MLQTQQGLSTVAIFDFQFKLYDTVAPLSFLRSISLASLCSGMMSESEFLFLPCYKRTELRLSSARQKNDVWAGPK